MPHTTAWKKEKKTSRKLEKNLRLQQKETMGNCPNNVQFHILYRSDNIWLQISTSQIKWLKKKGVPSSQASSPSTLRRCHHPPCPTQIVEQLPSHARISPGDLCKLSTCPVPFQKVFPNIWWVLPRTGSLRRHFWKQKKALKQTD